MATAVLGIDPSLTSTGLAVLAFTPGRRPRCIDSRRVATKPRQALGARLDSIACAVEQAVALHQPELVGIETGIVYRGHKTTLALAQVRGVVLLALHRAGVRRIIDVNNATARAAVGAKRAQGKAGVLAGVGRHVAGVRRLLVNEDEVDAMAICLAAWERRPAA